ncbi:MAG: DUF3883 domain-containing protein [Chloroflexota bacterium]|nr:DUF3883 domain-containing protein [Chloroflexota bacterium]
MELDYAAISAANTRRYGTDVGEYGPVLLASLYADRTHFIFELLQNAEDALRRRGGWNGPRTIRFDISEDSLTVTHFGRPFDQDDVLGISGIALSTKLATDIGQFGIGFKSVYAWTNRPEVHSGDHDFAIADYVHPARVGPIPRDPQATVIVIPFKSEVAQDRGQIAKALQRDAGAAIRFLREIDEIEWWVGAERQGQFLTERRRVAVGVDYLTVVGQLGDQESTEEWLVFSAPVTRQGQDVGSLELAFALNGADAGYGNRFRRLSHSFLAVYFPTEHETHLHFLAQGPYRTTPSRDNVLKQDPWNSDLVQETAALLKRTLRWLRDQDDLSPSVLECLPLDEGKFDASNMFSPLFAATKDALASERLLPAHPDGYELASQAVLGGTVALRELFDAVQLAELFAADGPLFWLSSDITADRTPALYQYLRRDLELREVASPETLVRRLTQPFLERQSDTWIGRLYEFLSDQHALSRQNWFKQLPLIRLADGNHVAPGDEDSPNAYLSAPAGLERLQVRDSLRRSKAAREFLAHLGLREFDPVDQVITEVLPKYISGEVQVDSASYLADITLVSNLYQNNSAQLRQRLVRALQATPFVRVRDAGTNEVGWALPGEAYLETKSIGPLFDGLSGVQFVSLPGPSSTTDSIRELLLACGVADDLRVVSVRRDHRSSDAEWQAVRDIVGSRHSTRAPSAEDWTIEHLTGLLDRAANDDQDRRAEIASLLWQCLCAVNWQPRRHFQGTYRWFYYRQQSRSFPAEFIRELNGRDWVPQTEGGFGRPGEVVFDSLGWPTNDLLLDEIEFLATPDPVEDQDEVERLAGQVGIDPEVLSLISEADDRTVEELMAFLRERKARTESPAQAGGTGQANQQRNVTAIEREAHTARSIQSLSRRVAFQSYVAVQQENASVERNSVEHEERMRIEQAAIEFILDLEPEWQPTPVNNPGFDLYQTDEAGEPRMWCEVKSLRGAWGDHPVAMTRTQFEMAREKRDRFWLYVVEHAEDDARQLFAIQDPVGRAEMYAFDRGWESIAGISTGLP